MNQFAAAGFEILKVFEGCRLTAYLDDSTPPIWTIGYGRTHNDNGGAILEGQTCSINEAGQWLLTDVKREGSHFVDAWVKTPLNDDQYTALSCLIYNIGCGTFKRSPIFSALQNGNYLEAAASFGNYITAGGSPLVGLIRRREAEKCLFLSDYIAMKKILDKQKGL